MSKILIVGASSGIGEETAKMLIAEGHEVISASRNQPSVAVSKHLTWDAANPDDSVFSEIEELDGIVYCPGTINLKPFSRLKTEDFLYDFQVNVLGAINVIQANVNKLRKSNAASVVLFSTVAVQTGMSFHTSVAASKGALEGLVRSLAAEYAANGIRFNAIAPSLTKTPLASALTSTEDKIEASNKRHPLGRIGTSEDLANAASYLISSKSSWVTGQIFHIDGGMGSLK